MAQPIPFDAVHHISRETADVARSLAFYRDVLGFEPIWRPHFHFDGAWLLRNGLQIHLIQGKPPPRPPDISSTRDHVALHTDDLATVLERLKEHGIPYARKVQTGTGVVQLFFHDPDGNHIEVGAYPPPRPPDPAGPK